MIQDILGAYVMIKGPIKADESSVLFCLGNAVKYQMRHGKKEGARSDKEKRDEYLGMGKICPKFWKDIAIPVIENSLKPPEKRSVCHMP